MSNAQAIEIVSLIPMQRVADAIGCTKRTVRSFCDRHGVPVTELSPKAHALTPENYALLLKRATEPQR